MVDRTLGGRACGSASLLFYSLCLAPFQRSYCGMTDKDKDFFWLEKVAVLYSHKKERKELEKSGN